MSEDVLDLGFTSFDELETTGGGGSQDPIITTMELDVGYFIYGSGPPQDRFYSLTKLGKEKAYEDYLEAFLANSGGEEPAEWQKQYHLQLFFSLSNIANRSAEDMPNWKYSGRYYFIQMKVSSDRERDQSDWVPYPYEGIKDSIKVIQSTLSLEKVKDVLNEEIWVAFARNQNQWDLWQIKRAQEGERTFNRFQDMSPEDVEWLPEITAVYANKEDASEGHEGSEIPGAPDGWDYGDWPNYYLTIVKAARSADEPKDLYDYVVNGEGEFEGTAVVSEGMINAIFAEANDEVPV